MQEFDITNRQIQLTIVLKLNQLQRLQYPNLTYDNLVDVLVDLKWKRKIPTSLHEAVNDILTLDADTVIQYMSKQAIIDGYRSVLSSYNDLLMKGVSHDYKEEKPDDTFLCLRCFSFSGFDSGRNICERCCLWYFVRSGSSGGI
ncbi:MAG: hypothetical protein IKU28_00075 [Erysipelotrichaceae bacterium]|nr:hypothetical protein [Erysipelotrichaceae bacterium]